MNGLNITYMKNVSYTYYMKNSVYIPTFTLHYNIKYHLILWYFNVSVKLSLGPYQLILLSRMLSLSQFFQQNHEEYLSILSSYTSETCYSVLNK